MDFIVILAMPVVLTAIGIAIVKFRKLSWIDDVGFRLPDPGQALFWVGAFAVAMVAQELLSQGDSAWGSWRGKYDAGEIALRIVAVGLLYPLAEEFFFRGVFLGVLKRRFGAVVAVAVTAAIFAVIHTQYDWPIWILIDGLLFGACRVASRSVYLPMALHVIGNSYGVWERLQ